MLGSDWNADTTGTIIITCFCCLQSIVVFILASKNDSKAVRIKHLEDELKGIKKSFFRIRRTSNDVSDSEYQSSTNNDDSVNGGLS